MSVARNIEISAQSTKSLEDAIIQAVQGAGETVRGITQFYVKDVKVDVENQKIVKWQVNGKMTFVVENR